VQLTVVAAENFRNLETFRFEPGARFNLFEGRNGQGKTNLLEAIYLLAAFRSSREAKTQELIRFGAERATIFGEIERRGISRTVELQLARDGKKVVLDGKAVTRLPVSLAHLNAVIFGPDDLELTKAAPEVRRRFLDRATYAVWPEHLLEMRAYHEALKHRNRLLREARLKGLSPDPALIEAFEGELARRGAMLQMRRHLFLEGFAPLFDAAFAAITDGELRASIRHETSGLQSASRPVEELRLALMATFAERRAGDVRMGYTRQGPHADDLLFSIEERPTRTFASQGQHRAFVLALKIAELERIHQALGVFPVFLLDDVSSELDERRNALLMQRLERGGGQVFITTTDRRWIKVADAHLWRVDAGTLQRG
jgi:DNA replication and repair protein RecF